MSQFTHMLSNTCLLLLLPQPYLGSFLPRIGLVEVVLRDPRGSRCGLPHSRTPTEGRPVVVCGATCPYSAGLFVGGAAALPPSPPARGQRRAFAPSGTPTPVFVKGVLGLGVNSTDFLQEMRALTRPLTPLLWTFPQEIFLSGKINSQDVIKTTRCVCWPGRLLSASANGPPIKE